MKTLYNAEEIASHVNELSEDINRFYEDTPPDSPVLVVGILNGAFIFLADLVRRLKFPVEIGFIRVGSYGDGDVSSGNICLSKEIDRNITGRKVLVVEDIVDTGRTLVFLYDYFRALGASDVRTAVLLNKKCRRTEEVEPDFTALEVPDVFIFGYGMDTGETMRNLPDICYRSL